jgi:hypothetical protein
MFEAYEENGQGLATFGAPICADATAKAANPPIFVARL